MPIHHDSDDRRSGSRSEQDAEGFDRLIHRVRSEFLEMPGLRLRVGDARRLWGLQEVLCEAILVRLVDERFLRRTRDGAFVRRTGEDR